MTSQLDGATGHSTSRPVGNWFASQPNRQRQPTMAPGRKLTERRYSLITTGHVNGTQGGVVRRLFLSRPGATALLDSTIPDRELGLWILVIRPCPGRRYLLR